MTDIATFLALVGLIVTIFQLVITNRQAVETQRPVIVLQLSTVASKAGDRLYLDIQNVGTTPARNVVISFEEGKAWHWVANPSYPFLNEFGGLPVLAPGVSVRYFLGVVVPSGQLAYLKSSSIIATAKSTRPLGFGTFVDRYSLTLATFRYRSKTDRVAESI